MKKKFIVTIPVYKSGNTELLNYISKINSNTLIIPQISSVRTDPSSLAYHIKQKYNKSVIITINTVDTNLRFIQSRILGAELFNLNNFLITKGDATSLQKTPEKQSKDSKAVYEQKTTKVMSSINQMNKGYDFIGNELESKTDCIFGSTVEINQTDNKYLNLIDKKIKLGSSYLISNPIYDGNMYNTFIKQYPQVVKVKNAPCNKGITKSFIDRKKISMDTLERDYDMDYWLDFCFAARLKEENLKISKAQYNMYLRNGRSMIKRVDISAGMNYINNMLKMLKSKQTNTRFCQNYDKCVD